METKNERQYPDLSFAKALVVDDMPSNLVVAAGFLKKFGIHADCINNGQEALDRIKKGDPVYNVIFMDQIMPGMDGTETVRRIRSLESEYAKKIPVIAISGDETPNTEEMFLKNGFQAFIAKPLSIAKLDTVLRELLGKA